MVKKTVKVRSYLRRIELRGIIFYRRVRSHKRATPKEREEHVCYCGDVFDNREDWLECEAAHKRPWPRA